MCLYRPGPQHLIPPEKRCPSAKAGYPCGLDKGHPGPHKAYCCSGPGDWYDDGEEDSGDAPIIVSTTPAC